MPAPIDHLLLTPAALTPAALTPAIDLLRAALPSVEAVYLFGSRAAGLATATSDFDLAILNPSPLDPVARFELASRLAEVLHAEVDLVDLRRASAVMRVQVLGNSRLLFDGDSSARAVFEAFALSDYARLNEERRGILDDVRARGSIGG